MSADAGTASRRAVTPSAGAASSFVLFAVLIWILFCAIHPLIRLAFDLALGPADSLEMLASQDLKFNYRPRQPPFYSWLMWSSTQVFGPTPLAVQVVKYGLMAIAGFGFFMAGLAATGDRVRAALGMLMVLMVFNVGFTIHDQSTHSVGLIAGLGLLFWGYAGLARDDGWRTYALIGIAGAISVLSKHSAWLVVIAFPLAFMVIPRLRPRVLSLKFAAALSLTILAALPLLMFLLENRQAAAGHLSETISVKPGEAAGWLNPLTALGTLAGGWLILVVPIAGVLAVAFTELRGRWRDWTPGADTDATSDIARAIWLGVAIILAVIAIGLLAAGAAKIPSRHLLIAVIPTALILAWNIPSAAITHDGLIRLLVIVAGLQAASAVSRVAVYAYPGKPLCKRCNHVLPIRDLAHAITQRIGTPATLVSNARVSIGNLRTFLPDTRMVFTGLPTTAAPAARTALAPGVDQTCYFLLRGENGRPTAHRSFDNAAILDATRKAEPVLISLPWPRVIGDANRTTTWQLLPLPASLEVCGG